MPKGNTKDFRLMLPIILITVFADQISKTAIRALIAPNESVVVIDGFFNLVFVKNQGIAFGIMNKQGIVPIPCLLIGSTIVAIILLMLWYVSFRQKNTWINIAVALIMGGAVGNLIDRIRFSGVVDFLDCHVGSWHWPAFNIADSAITTGVIILFFNLFLGQTSYTKHQAG